MNTSIDNTCTGLSSPPRGLWVPIPPATGLSGAGARVAHGSPAEEQQIEAGSDVGDQKSHSLFIPLCSLSFL